MKGKVLYWSPRILAILSVLFMMMFSADCFGDGNPIGKQLSCFLMHNIPVFILTMVLIISWKWEMVGGILFILLTIAACYFFRVFSGNMGALIVLTPFLLTGILFILDDVYRNRNTVKEPGNPVENEE
jgi:hypothetical protein